VSTLALLKRVYVEIVNTASQPKSAMGFRVTRACGLIAAFSPASCRAVGAAATLGSVWLSLNKTRSTTSHGKKPQGGPVYLWAAKTGMEAGRGRCSQERPSATKARETSGDLERCSRRWNGASIRRSGWFWGAESAPSRVKIRFIWGNANPPARVNSAKKAPRARIQRS
jgi:hypothetical protein